nr:hypothetical protein [Polyangiaceae bacterium]
VSGVAVPATLAAAAWGLATYQAYKLYHELRSVQAAKAREDAKQRAAKSVGGTKTDAVAPPAPVAGGQGGGAKPPPPVAPPAAGEEEGSRKGPSKRGRSRFKTARDAEQQLDEIGEARKRLPSRSKAKEGEQTKESIRDTKKSETRARNARDRIRNLKDAKDEYD